MNAIKVHHDVRSSFGPARDQGIRATCLAFAMSDAHAAARDVEWSPLSCEYLFYRAKQRDHSSPDSGSTVRATCAALELDGQPFETAWPYLTAVPTDPTHWKPPAVIGTLFRRASAETEHAFPRVWDAVRDGQPIVLGVTLSDAFYEPDKYGIVDASQPVEASVRHAVVAVAIGESALGRLLLVRNSWGEAWGLSGHAWLSERYADPRILFGLTVN